MIGWEWRRAMAWASFSRKEDHDPAPTVCVTPLDVPTQRRCARGSRDGSAGRAVRSRSHGRARARPGDRPGRQAQRGHPGRPDCGSDRRGARGARDPRGRRSRRRTRVHRSPRARTGLRELPLLCARRRDDGAGAGDWHLPGRAVVRRARRPRPHQLRCQRRPRGRAPGTHRARRIASRRWRDHARHEPELDSWCAARRRPAPTRFPGGARTRRGSAGHRVRHRVHARREPRGDPPRVPGRGASRRALLRTLTRGRAGPGYRGQRGGAARGDRRRGGGRGFFARGPRDEHGPARHTAPPPAHSRRPRARPRCHDGSVPVHRGVHRSAVRGVRSRLAAAHVHHLSRYPLSSHRRTPDPRQLRATPPAGSHRRDLPDSGQHGPTDARRLARDGGQRRHLPPRPSAARGDTRTRPGALCARLRRAEPPGCGAQDDPAAGSATRTGGASDACQGPGPSRGGRRPHRVRRRARAGPGHVRAPGPVLRRDHRRAGARRVRGAEQRVGGGASGAADPARALNRRLRSEERRVGKECRSCNVASWRREAYFFPPMPHPKFPNLTVLDHPLIQHKLSILRDKNTPTRDFKQLVNEIAMLMAYEVTKDLPLETAEVETPLERMRGVRVAGKTLALVPILRAGLGRVEGIAQLIPSARVGHIGIYREHDTLEPVDYYFKIPSGEDARDFFVLDPMLATGGSAADAVSALKHAGAQRIRFLCLVAAPEGVRRMLESHPDVPVFAAAKDLNQRYRRVLAARFAVTLGDELQCLLPTPQPVWDLAHDLRARLPTVDWVVACGRGPITTPLAPTAPEMDGPCFHEARAAMDRAKRQRQVFAFGRFAPALEPLASYYSALYWSWTPRQRRTATLLRLGDPAAAAARLDVDRSAISHLARRMAWPLVAAGDKMFRALLEAESA